MRKILLTLILPAMLLSACDSSDSNSTSVTGNTGVTADNGSTDALGVDSGNTNNSTATDTGDSANAGAGGIGSADSGSADSGSVNNGTVDNGSSDTDSENNEQGDNGATSGQSDSGSADTGSTDNGNANANASSDDLLRSGLSHRATAVARTAAIANDPLVLATGRDRVASLPNALAIMYEVAHNQGGSAGINCSALGAQFNSCSVVNLHIKDAAGVLNDTQWKLYFHSTRRVLKVESDDLTVHNVNGDLHYVSPLEGFAGFAGGVKTIKMITEFQQLVETDFQPRYWVARGNDTTLITNTDEETNESAYAMDITGTDRFEFVGETNEIATPALRYNNNVDVTTAANALTANEVQSRIIPKPASISVLPGSLDISGGLSFASSGLPASSIEALQNRATLLVGGSSVQVQGAINTALGNNTYSASVTSNGINIEGSNESMLFYAAQSVLALIQPGVGTVPLVEISDSPRTDFRSMHIDVARNFHSVASIKKLMDQMAAYKLNQLHLHLSDDEGWRLEIPSMPELSAIGGTRAFEVDSNGLVTETSSLMPAMGSGPNSNNQGSGFYSRAEFVDLLQYADARFINVIPEFDMPAHARAAVVAMRNRALNLGNANDINIRLDDPDDTSVYRTVQNYYDSIINPCVPGTYTFIETLVQDVQSMYADAGTTLSAWHMGGDEAINILTGFGFAGQDTSAFDEPWARSPVCQSYIAATDGVNSREDLASHFVQRVAEIINNAGIPTLIAFQDIYSDSNADSLQSTNVAAGFWAWLSGNGTGTTEAANSLATRGFQVIVHVPDYLYFDFPYEVDPKERGYYWASRQTNTQKVFTFSPENLPQNAETSLNRFGDPWTATGNSNNPGITGTEAMLWSETVRTPEQFDYMIFPRMLAYAERAWHRADWELPYTAGRTFSSTSGLVNKTALAQDYAEFAAALGQKELAKLDAAGVAYRVPLPGASLAGGQLQDMNIGLPGLALEYSLDGSSWQTWNGSSPSGTVQAVRARSANGARSSRTAAVE